MMLPCLCAETLFVWQGICCRPAEICFNIIDICSCVFVFRYAFIHYSDEAIAKEAHDSMQDYVYQGRTLVVMYGKKTSPEAEKAAQEGKRKAPPAKGTKE